MQLTYIHVIQYLYVKIHVNKITHVILQYIGICSLYQNFHDGDYGEFLFLLGKLMLTEKLSEIDNEKDD